MKKLISILAKIFSVTCKILGAAVLLCLLVGIIGIYKNYSQPEVVKNSYLSIDLDADFTQTANQSLIDDFIGKESVSFLQLIKAIEVAANDENIDGIVAKINTVSLNLAQINELADTIEKFKKTHKKTFLYSYGFGNFSAGNKEYYLASFFDRIYMQPHTYIGLTGINIEVPFFKNILNKFGVQPEFYSRYEYKTAMASLTDDNMSVYYRDELNRLAHSIMDNLLSAIRQNRKLEKSAVQIMDMAPIKAQDGLDMKMIDGIMYFSEFEKQVRSSGAKKFIDLNDYVSLIVGNQGDIPAIALLSLNGVIDRKSDMREIGDEETIESDKVREVLAQIAKIENLKALVVRVNSPGGDYNAADEIYADLVQIKKQKNIPLVVTQGGYAASGGYFVSLAADYIFAEPLTITGSIGVFGGKFDLSETWKKLGVSWDSVSYGKNAGFLSLNKPFNASEKQIFNASLDEVYSDFTQKVVQNRPLKQDIDKIARGRIWLGFEAKELGLVDELGGYDAAIFKAIRLSGMDINKPFKLEEFPHPKSNYEKIMELFDATGIKAQKILGLLGVNMNKINLFKRWQYDMVLIPFELDL